MSDSDDELLSNSVFTLPNDGSTMISARGPKINTSLAIPRTFAPPQYAESNYKRQRYTRDMSPMSMASACDARFRTFNNSYYPGAMSSQRSAYNWRSGSPMSTRTCDTNTTLSATDIAQALSNKFSKRDARIINKAIQKWKEMDKYKRIEKRRKQRMFLQRNRRLSYNSGDQASLSSNSDDNRSTKTTGFRENMSVCRSTKTDISDFRRTIQESNIYRYDNSRQNTSRNFHNRPASNSTLMSMNSARNMNKNSHDPRNKRVFVFGNQSNFQLQKERFQNGFQLPSQRFDRSIATSTIHEKQRHNVDDTDSDDNIFSVNKALPKRKRSIDEEDVLTDNKRPRVVSPCANSTEARRTKEIDNTNTITKTNDFVFAKPSLPIKKIVKEKLISQSAPPPNIEVSEFTEKPISNEITKDNEEIPHNISTDVSMRPSFIKRKLFTQKLDVAENKNVSSDSLSANSPQGSIYKAIQKEKHKARKLITNQSCLNREINDESNLLELIHKIVPANSMNVTTQSNKTDIQSTTSKPNNSDKWDISSIISTKNNEDDCSDTFTDEEIFNSDNTVKTPSENSEKTTKSNLQNNNNKKVPNLEKVPSKDRLVVPKNVPSKDKDPISEKVISKDKHTISEEVARKDKLPISKQTVTKDKLPVTEKPAPVFKKPDQVSPLQIQAKNCKVLVQNIPIGNLKGPGLKTFISKFWETDSESDVECLPAKRNNFLKPQERITPQIQGVAGIFNKPNAILNNSIISMAETTQKFNASSFKIKSHRTLKPKKCCDDNKENTLKSYFEPLNKKQKSNEPIQTDNKICDDKIVTQKNNINTTKKQREIKRTPTKILRTPPKAKQNKKNVEVENTDEASRQKESTKKQPTKAQAKNKETATSAKKQERATAQSKQQKTAKAQAKKQEKATVQVKKQETATVQAKKQETATVQAKKQETATSQAKKQETATVQAKKQETANTKVKETQNKIKQIATAKKSESKTAKDTKTPPKTKTKEKEPPKIQENSKNKRNKKITLEDSSLTNSTLENDSSKMTRTLRSCRLKSLANSSNDSFNLTMTLRPRKTSSKVKCIDLLCSRKNERTI